MDDSTNREIKVELLRVPHSHRRRHNFEPCGDFLTLVKTSDKGHRWLSTAPSREAIRVGNWHCHDARQLVFVRALVLVVWLPSAISASPSVSASRKPNAKSLTPVGVSEHRSWLQTFASACSKISDNRLDRFLLFLRL